MTASEPASLLSLPYELHCAVVRHLPLPAHILYQTQVCRTLRMAFGHRWTFDDRSDIFRLVEWRRASICIKNVLERQRQQQQAEQEESAEVVVGRREVGRKAKSRSIWDTSPSATPKPAPAQAMSARDVVRTSSHSTTLLSSPFVARQVATHSPQDVLCDENVGLSNDAIDFDVKLFIRSLRLLGNLPPVAAAITTDALDDDVQKPPLLPLQAPGSIRVLSLLSRTGFRVNALIHLLRTVPALLGVETILMTAAGYYEMLLWSVYKDASPSYIETQAIVVPGPHAQRGRGLQSGFKCFCFDPARNDSDAVFHVIFHDWYDEQEAEGVQSMLECSDITCNSCKRSIYV